MNKHLLKPIYLIIALLLIIAMPVLALWPDHFFITGNTPGFMEWFFIVIILFAAISLLSLFVISFVNIQRKGPDRKNAIFTLLGSLISLLFLMVAKVMADEVAHEWPARPGSVFQLGEFWLLYVCLGFAAGFLIIAGLKQKRISG